MQSLTDFLLQRIAEDEAEIRLLGALAVGHRAQCIFEGGYEGTTQCDCGAVGRRLAECEAKRRIVELHPRHDWLPVGRDECAECGCADDNSVDWPCPTLRALALPYADHPDYREEFKP